MTTEKPPSFFSKLMNLIRKKPFSVNELHHALAQANESHLIDHDAYQMMEGVLNVGNLTVEDFMIPRSQMVVFKLGEKISTLLPELIESGHSRFPVIDEDRDNIVGILMAKDLLKYMNQSGGSETVLELSMLRTPRFVPETKHLDTLLKEFKAKRDHIALVMDEYGGISGLITIEDVLEQIVGDIEDEFDDESEENFIVPSGDNRYIVAALTPIETFNQFFKAELRSENVDTVGGFLMEQLEHIPVKNEDFSFPPFEFTVKEADNRRIHEIYVRVLPSE